MMTAVVTVFVSFSETISGPKTDVMPRPVKTLGMEILRAAGADHVLKHMIREDGNNEVEISRRARKASACLRLYTLECYVRPTMQFHVECSMVNSKIV